jgi:lipid II:glycine glycyltransferase (peptidoglycan interpeptide bridge formation enzyme)
VADENDFETFDALFDGIKQLAKEYKAYCIKIDPEIVVQNTAYKQHLIEKEQDFYIDKKKQILTKK